MYVFREREEKNQRVFQKEGYAAFYEALERSKHFQKSERGQEFQQIYQSVFHPLSTSN